jgi:hypothetical protein
MKGTSNGSGKGLRRPKSSLAARLGFTDPSTIAAVAPFGAEASRIAARDREMNRDREPFDLVEVAGRQEE